MVVLEALPESLFITEVSYFPPLIVLKQIYSIFCFVNSMLKQTIFSAFYLPLPHHRGVQA